MTEEQPRYDIIEISPPQVPDEGNYPIVLQRSEYTGVLLHSLIQETTGIKDILAPEMAYVLAKKKFERATFYIPPLEKDMLQFYEATVRMIDSPSVEPARRQQKSGSSEQEIEEEIEAKGNKLIYYLHPDTIEESMVKALGGAEGCMAAFRAVVDARRRNDTKALNSLFGQIIPGYYREKVASMVQQGMDISQIATDNPEMFEDLLAVLNAHTVRNDRVTTAHMTPEDFQAKADAFLERADAIIAHKNDQQQVDALKHIIGMAGKMEKERVHQGYSSHDPYRVELRRITTDLRILQRELWHITRIQTHQKIRILQSELSEQISREIRTVGGICFQNAQRMTLQPSAPDLQHDIATLSSRVHNILNSLRQTVAI